MTNIGETYFSAKKFNKALIYFEKAQKFYTKNTDIYPSEQAALYGNMALVHAELGHIKIAKYYVEKTVSYSNKENGDRYIEGVFEGLVKVYTRLNDSENAFKNLISLNEIRDSLYHPEILNNVTNIQKDYNRKRRERENRMKTELLKQDQLLEEFKLYILSGILITMFLFILLLFYKVRHKTNLSLIELNNNKLKQQQLSDQLKLKQIELKNSQLEQQQLSDQIKFKNDELSNYAMYIVKKNDFLESLKNEVDHLKTKTIDKVNIKSLSTVINQHLNSTRERKDFEVRIEKGNEDFYYKLQKVHPNLSEKDKKLCSLLLLELSSKDIASILNIESASADKSRHRLRKKLEIDSDTNLSQYLKQL
jgi:hypothetical protein